MRVGLVCAHANPSGPSSGTHQHVTRLAAELTVRGHDVRLYERADESAAAGPAPAAPAAGYRLERVPEEPSAASRSNRLVASVSAFGRWLADRWSTDWTPDVVHGHYWVGGLAAATAVRSTAIPVVQTFHSLAAEQQRHLGSAYTGPGERAVLERVLGRAVDVAVAQSADEVDELTRMGVPRTSVAVVPAGVDTEMFTPEGEAQPRPRRGARIVSVGLEPGHGQDDVIRALRRVGDAELVILGGPPAAELAGHAEARRLAELAHRAGVGERVRFVGAVPDAELPSWYRSADVVACTPRCAPVDGSAVQAMACGVPVVGYEIGSIAESVVSEVTGRLVPPGDVPGLGAGLRRLINDDAERFAYANAAVDRVRCRYTWDRSAAGLERAYERALARRRPVTAPAGTDQN